MLRARELGNLTALDLARRLADRPGLAVLASSDPAAAWGRYSFVASDPNGLVDRLDPFEGEPAGGRGPLAFAPRFIGVVPYEALRAGRERAAWVPDETRAEPLAAAVRWAEYPAVIVIDHQTDVATIVGESEEGVRDLERWATRDPIALAPFDFEVRSTEADAVHVERVAHAIELIRAGDLYQVNLARRLALEARTKTGNPLGPAERIALFAALTRAAPASFGALLEAGEGTWIVSSSPELLLDAAPDASGSSFGDLITEPIKGTRPRSSSAGDDAALAAELDADPKERAELAMIVDVERNDLARVSERGSVEVAGAPRVVSHRTVHHRVATVRGRARAGVSRDEVLRAMLPSGSVTGAPKVRAMEVIARLESARRGVYTGAFGYAGHDGSMRLAMAIRTCVIGPDGHGEYGVGGGIVVDSDPARELEETRWKSVQLAEIMRAAGERG
ncbi:MAG: anthranilate synthase component I family protein [Polyangiaceae bacterium]|nr:anthranilate synthase component I family protein [Polyangiaceae bacterium]